MDVQMNETVKLLRSLITSSDGMLVHEIEKEYQAEVGESIPFRKFGFNTLTEFLKSTNQFNGKSTSNGLKVTAKISSDSAHITQMRRAQNISQAEKKRRKKAKGKTNCSLMRPKVKSSAKISKSVRSKHLPVGGAMKRTELKPKFLIQPSQNVNRAPAATPFALNKPANPPRVAMSNPTTVKEPSKKLDLHRRFVEKQPFFEEPQVPIEPERLRLVAAAMSSPKAMPIPVTPPETPPSSRSSSVNEQPKRVKLSARLASKKFSSIGSQKMTDFNQINTTSSSTSGRASLLKIYQGLKNQQKSGSDDGSDGDRCTGTQLQNKNEPKKEERSHDLHSLHDSKESVTATSTNEQQKRSDLYSRLASKQVSPVVTQEVKQLAAPVTSSSIRNTLLQMSKNRQQEKCPENGVTCEKVSSLVSQSQRSIEPFGAGPSGKKHDIHARLRSKQIDIEMEDMDQINKQLNNVTLMDVDNERNKVRLNEMDWEQLSWTRSIKKCNEGIQITVHF